MKNLSILLCAAALVFGVVGISHAKLYDRGGGLIYCDTLDITLLQDAHANGAWIRMKWHEAMAWAENLEYYDSVRNVTWDDWRLPDPRNQDGSGPFLGFNYTNSEMGHIYYIELGNKPLSGGFSNSGPFKNIQTTLTYWMNMKPVEKPGYAYRFDFSSGDMSYGGEINWFNVWAVRDGDVGIPPVPSAGADQIVFNEVTLDGSQSYDPNGLIESYQWYLQNKEDSFYDLTDDGINPTISALKPGFYEVTLTVTDNDGLTGTDIILLAVAGSCREGVVVIDNCDTRVWDRMYKGQFISEWIEEYALKAKNHRNFVNNVARLAAELTRIGLINPCEKIAIKKCTAKASMP